MIPAIEDVIPNIFLIVGFFLFWDINANIVIIINATGNTNFDSVTDVSAR